MKFSLKLIMTAFAAASLVACGGSSSGSSSNAASYSGKKTPANFSTLSEEQQQETGKASATVVYEAVDSAESGNYLGRIPLAVKANNGSSLSAKNHQKLQKLVKRQATLIQQNSNELENLPLAAKLSHTVECELGGSHTVSGDINENTGNGSVKIVYKNCKEDWSWGDEEEWDLTNGTISAKITSSSNKTTMRIEFSNFQSTEFYDGKEDKSVLNGFYEVTYNGSFDDLENFDEYGSFSAKWSLTGTDNGKPVSAKGEMSCNDGDCKFTADIKTEDGKTYRVEDLTVNEGWPDTVTGKIYHPDHGYYSFEAQIYYFCDDGEKSPFEGEATFTDENGEEIHYESNDCGNAPSIF